MGHHRHSFLFGELRSQILGVFAILGEPITSDRTHHATRSGQTIHLAEIATIGPLHRLGQVDQTIQPCHALIGPAGD